MATVGVKGLSDAKKIVYRVHGWSHSAFESTLNSSIVSQQLVLSLSFFLHSLLVQFELPLVILHLDLTKWWVVLVFLFISFVFQFRVLDYM